MNYQPLFDLMSTHGLTLLEGEMQEIIDVVNEMQQQSVEPTYIPNESVEDFNKRIGKHLDTLPITNPKKLTYGEFERLANVCPSYPNLYDAIFPYLADEQPSQFTALGSTTLNPPTKPEPSRLEVAAMIYAHGSMTAGEAVDQADELIKQAKG